MRTRMRRRARHGVIYYAFGALGSVLSLALLASLTAALLTAAVAPVVAGAGVGAKSAADTFQGLPTTIAEAPLPAKSRFLAADGSLIANFYRQNRDDLPPEQIPQVLRDAVVSIEDTRFFEHHGVDYRGVVRAAAANQRSGAVEQGASTITQQYVKNALVAAAESPEDLTAAQEQTVDRKLREMRYALELEKVLTKDEILERYVSIAYYGDGAYGLQAAAVHYFGVSAKDLSLSQSAMLAGLVQSPSRYDPTDAPESALGRRDVVLDSMLTAGRITTAEHAAATAEPLGLNVTLTGNGCAQSPFPFYCDWVLRSLLEDKALGATREERMEVVLTGGLTVTTTLDPAVQAASDAAVQKHVPVTEQAGAALGMVVPGTGAVKALAVNRVFGEGAGQSTVNYATGGSSGFQSGSTFKVFVLAAALEKGVPLTTVYDSPATYASPVYKNYRPGKGYEPYTVRNASDSEDGNFDMVRGTWDSVNTYYIQLQQEVGIEAVAEMAERLGVSRADGSPLERVPALTLGTNEVSPLKMAGAYATFAAGGMYCEPYGVESVTDRTGAALEVSRVPCVQAVSPEVAAQVAGVLRGVITSGTGRSADIGRPAAGKTGTVQDYAAAWFVGFTPQLASAVWVGDPRGGYAHPLRNVRINGKRYAQVYGGTIPAPLWGDAMEGALAGAKVVDLPPFIKPPAPAAPAAPAGD